MKIEYEDIAGKTKFASLEDGAPVDKKSDSNGSVYFTPRDTICKDDELLTILTKVRSVILSTPEYVNRNDIPWMLAHIDELMDMAAKEFLWIVEYKSPHDIPFGCGFSLFKHQCEGKDLIYVVRFFYLLQFISSHLYGANAGTFNRGSKTKRFKPTSKIIGSNSEYTYFKREANDHFLSRQFNQSMNWDLADYRIVFKPDEIVTDNIDFDSVLKQKKGLLVGSVAGYTNAKNPGYGKAVLGSFSNKNYIAENIELEFSIYFVTYIDIEPPGKNVKSLRLNVPLESVIAYSDKRTQFFYPANYKLVPNASKTIKQEFQNAVSAAREDNNWRVELHERSSRDFRGFVFGSED